MTRVYTPAPIALFAYNRPQHLRRTVEALAANALAPESKLFVFLDGPKNDGDKAISADIRAYVASIGAFQSVSLVEQEKNIGLAASIIGGVSRMLETYESVIVMEDDIVTSPFFLRYMNDAINIYRDDEAVACIHGFVYEMKGLPETFFLRGADCWGWATWQRAWRAFESDGNRLLREIEDRGLQHEFDLDGTVHYTQMLREQIEGRNDSWAIRWHASAFLKGMLTLHPGRSLVRNIGLDGSGTHCHNVPAHLLVDAKSRSVNVARLPLKENLQARNRIVSFLRRQSRSRDCAAGVFSRAIRRLRSVFFLK
ncbi:glycosyl transferase [Spartobacteria bacterium LR76]|nr:glycosyl transferase [Spartobacteria bacterium LR76]